MLVEAYTIPTSSMEKSLLVGDFLFVSKISYGPKVPNTPISFPFVHHTLPLAKHKTFVEWIKLPYHRFPGISEIEHNDVVVFNFPVGDTVSERYQSNRSYSTRRDTG
ncbi:MAG: S26 family signal peptidase [Bacteroidales bacterium]|nr:S26 family signal peptidase [Bacteroidales bacterium]